MLDDRYRRRLAEGDVVFRQGDRGDQAYVVEAGELEVVLDRAGQRDVLGRVGPGALVGEMALLDDTERMATVTATQPCTLRVLTRQHLSERLDLADPLLRHVLHVITLRYREAVQKLGGPVAAAVPVPSVLSDRTGDYAAVIDNLELEQDLELAVENGEFALHYQPIVRTQDETIAGFEALVRWQHPKRGLLKPDDFIPLAERTGLIVPLGQHVTRIAIEALALFDRLDTLSRGTEPLFMTVNLSGHQFSDGRLVELIGDALAYRELDPARLRLEITESSLLDRFRSASTLLRQCHELGVGLSVDDFGTGYSALSYLYRLPVSGVKFARRFIRDLARYPASQQVVGAVSRLARELGMDTVCEGVETAEQAATVRALDIPFMQGFHYAPALPLPATISFLRHSRRRVAPGAAVELRAA